MLSNPNPNPITDQSAASNASSGATHSQSTHDNKNRARSHQELIKQNVQFLIEQLEAGHSEVLTAYLDAMSHFHNYSFGNILLIARQKPNATNVAGMYAWNQLGRRVKRGEKGIAILAPMVGKPARRREVGIESEDDKPTPKSMVLGFRRVYVWDEAQTEGAPLPEAAAVKGEVGSHLDRLRTFVTGSGIELEYSEKIAPALGISYSGKIALLPGQTKAEEFTALVHEMAHELLHQTERRTVTTKAVRETEAEAIAFVVAKAIGLTPGTASADYIHLYHGNASLLTESLAVIQQTSAVFLDVITTELAEEAQDTPEVEAVAEVA